MKNQYGILKKSNRAIEAEEEGKVTYSKLKAWQKRAVDRGVIKPCEWHHTGAAANQTNYYDLAEFEELDKDDFKFIKNETINQPDLSRLKIQIIYDKAVSGFTGKNIKWEEISVEGLDVRKKDNVITGAKGRRITSNNKKVFYLYKAYRKKKFKKISKSEAENLGYKFI